jgi:hypothetical protein
MALQTTEIQKEILPLAITTGIISVLYKMTIKLLRPLQISTIIAIQALLTTIAIQTMPIGEITTLKQTLIYIQITGD